MQTTISEINRDEILFKRSFHNNIHRIELCKHLTVGPSSSMYLMFVHRGTIKLYSLLVQRTALYYSYSTIPGLFLNFKSRPSVLIRLQMKAFYSRWATSIKHPKNRMTPFLLQAPPSVPPVPFGFVLALGQFIYCFKCSL